MTDKRLTSKMRINPQTGCWDWTASKNTDGYGRVRIFGRELKAHRASYEAAKGHIPDGLHVLHKCDNPACINPEHLFLGTHAQNMADKVAKGRQLRGEKFPTSRLKDEDVIAIRAASGVVGTRLAEQYGVSTAHISRIRSGLRRAPAKGA